MADQADTTEMTELPKLAFAANGKALTPHMKAMGITGMVEGPDGWLAAFETYGGSFFLLPLPVAEWLLAEGQAPADNACNIASPGSE